MWKQQHGKPGPAHDNRCDVNHPNEGQDHGVGHHNPDCNHNTTTSTPQVTVPGSTVVVTFPVKHTTTSTALVQIGDAASVSSSTTVTVGVAKELPNTGSTSLPLGIVGGGSVTIGLALMAFAAKSALIKAGK